MGASRFSGRADLLRALNECTDEDAADEERFAGLLRLHARADRRRVPAPEPGQATAKGASPPTGVSPEREPVLLRRPPLQARFFAILDSERLNEPEPSNPASSLRPLEPADCVPRAAGEPLHRPLVGRTRLWPALHRALACPRLGRVDVPALVRLLSNARPLHRLPRRRFRNWGSGLVVILDRAPHLVPYDADYAQLLAEVRRLHDAAGLVVWTVLGTPDAPLEVQHGHARAGRADGPMQMPPAGTPVLILGDLGLLSPGRVAEPAWADYCRRVGEAGGVPVAWVPMSGALVSARIARVAQVHCLGEGDLRPLRRAGGNATPAPLEALEVLLTRMACCVRVEPPLLRSLRRMGADTAGEPGLEALVWGHAPVVLSGSQVCELAPGHVARYRAAFAELDVATQVDILCHILEVHRYRGRATECIEALIWCAHAPDDVTLPDELATRVAFAKRWFERLASQPGTAAGDAAGYARELLARQGGDAQWVRKNSAQLAPLWALTGEANLPDGLDSGDVARACRAADAAPNAFELVQRGEDLWLLDQRSQSNRRVIWFYQNTAKRTSWAQLEWPSVDIRGGLEWHRGDGTPAVWLSPAEADDAGLRLPLAPEPATTAYQLVSAGRRHRIGLLARPSWALDWGRDKDGLYALAPSPLGEPVKLRWRSADSPTDTSSTASGGWPLSPRAFSAADALEIAPGMWLGSDICHGLFLEVEISGVVQRFRWIEPGEFLMGSPKGEPDRYEGEGPQHVVRITRGYWLAETACSQALWHAVMGENPSGFSEDGQNPVEQVSWDDVEGFLRRVEGGLPGISAALPTEAEWEYACRAGTRTAFNFGTAITPGQANYDGTEGYAGGPTGEDRQKTVAVKSFAPNAWGLYQMHGNVWEWCADGKRVYDGSAQTDPRGPEGDEGSRVVRGGAWYYGPGWLRAAYRDQRHRDSRFDSLGFRFSLRSTSPPGGAERRPEDKAAQAGPRGESPAPGGRRHVVSPEETARRDAGPSSWVGKLKSVFVDKRSSKEKTPPKPERKK